MPPPALAGRRIVLGVCGGIAAYKAVEVCRRLTDAGALVSPVLTRSATRFVAPLTFSALAAEPAQTSLFEGSEPIPHTRLGQQADLIVVAPATARLLGAYAAGISSDLLTSTLLATRAPVLVAPAMHTEMWEHPAVQANLDTLRRRGVQVVEPTKGRLAGGDIGAGRLAEPADIVAAASVLLASAGSLAGVRAVVSAGGTREPIDAVRYIGNRSSGKQGYAIAIELAARGAAVTLVSTSSLPDPPGVQVIEVETAAQMRSALLPLAQEAAVVVMAAAVADFRPAQVVDHKIKKDAGVPDVILEPTNDILAELGAHRRGDQVLVGFAAETAGGSDEVLVRSARDKLTRKHADLLVANDVTAPGVGFSHDTNAVILVDGDGTATPVSLRGKVAVAAAVVDAVAALLAARVRPAAPTVSSQHPSKERV